MKNGYEYVLGELDLDDAYFGYHVKLILSCNFII